MLIILFGLAGAGKNFVGEIISSYFNMHFWDADQVLPKTMQASIQQEQIFTQAMRDEFTQIIIENIKLQEAQHPHLVVAQALYKEKNRQQILLAFPQAIFIHIVASEDKILARLTTNKSTIAATYAVQISKAFELPELPHCVIYNESDKNSIIIQLEFINKLILLSRPN